MTVQYGSVFDGGHVGKTGSCSHEFEKRSLKDCSVVPFFSRCKDTHSSCFAVNCLWWCQDGTLGI